MAVDPKTMEEIDGVMKTLGKGKQTGTTKKGNKVESIKKHSPTKTVPLSEIEEAAKKVLSEQVQEYQETPHPPAPIMVSPSSGKASMGDFMKKIGELTNVLAETGEYELKDGITGILTSNAGVWTITWGTAPVALNSDPEELLAALESLDEEKAKVVNDLFLDTLTEKLAEKLIQKITSAIGNHFSISLGGIAQSASPPVPVKVVQLPSVHISDVLVDKLKEYQKKYHIKPVESTVNSTQKKTTYADLGVVEYCSGELLKYGNPENLVKGLLFNHLPYIEYEKAHDYDGLLAKLVDVSPGWADKWYCKMKDGSKTTLTNMTGLLKKAWEVGKTENGE